MGLESEKELIELATKGDERAFATLMGRYDCSVRGYLRKLCSTQVDYNDLMQLTYIKAYLNIEKYNSHYPFEVWLKAIARNNFIDALRKIKIRVDDREDGSDVEEYSCESPEDIFISNERSENIENKLSLLPPHYQQIIDMRYFGALSYTEIAEQLELPIGTVKTRLHRARQMLINILETVSQ